MGCPVATLDRRRPPDRAPGPEPVGNAGLKPLLSVWTAWFVLMMGVNLAAPLYAVYAVRFEFSSLVLTAIFATYAFTLLPALLVFGRLSDRVGRRPLILAGAVTACIGLALFAGAQGTAWLFAARAFQGIAVGMISGPATAALVELDPNGDGQRPALLAGLAQAGGSAFAPLLAGVLITWAFAPEQLSYLVGLALTIIAAAFVLRLPDPPREAREPWRIQWPRVPREIRRDFARVSLTAAAVWAAMALYLSIVPSYASDLLETDNRALLGAISAVALASSCVVQVVSQRRRPEPRRAEAWGLVLLAAGLVGLAAASPLGSLAVLLGGAVAAGAGHGLGFISAQDELNAIAPATRRAEVTAAFISCIYAGVAGAVIACGVLDLRVSLGLAVGGVAALLAAAALATALWQLAEIRRERGRESAPTTGARRAIARRADGRGRSV